MLKKDDPILGFGPQLPSREQCMNNVGKDLISEVIHPLFRGVAIP